MRDEAEGAPETGGTGAAARGEGMAAGAARRAHRIAWIDQFRGFTVLYLVVCWLVPWPAGNRLIAVLFAHAPRDATWVSMRDVATSVFIFIMGLLLAHSFVRHCRRSGGAVAVRHVLLRSGLILILGMVMSYLGHGALLRRMPVDGVTVVILDWDVLQAIGMVGIVAIPFLFLPASWRLVAGYALLVFYQVMLSVESTGWRLQAVASAHGGVLASIFSISALLIIASALGQFLLPGGRAGNRRRVAAGLALFGVANVAAGLVAALLPQVSASKRLVSLPYSLLSIGSILLLGLVFVGLERAGRASGLLDAFGRNPFLIYIVTALLHFALFEAKVAGGSGWLLWAIALVSLVAVATLALRLHARGTVVRTERVAAAALLVLLVLAALLIPTGIYDLPR